MALVQPPTSATDTIPKSEKASPSLPPSNIVLTTYVPFPQGPYQLYKRLYGRLCLPPLTPSYNLLLSLKQYFMVIAILPFLAQSKPATEAEIKYFS